MQIIRKLTDYAPGADLCLTIGNFDGVHIGHRALIRSAQEFARENGNEFAIMTFWPHPRSILPGKGVHHSLTTREERLELLAALGVPLLFELPFDMRLAAMSAQDFVRDCLAPMHVRTLVLGHDFTLGRNREGSLAVLRELGEKHNITIRQIPAVLIGNSAASSSRLREYISAGDMESAQVILGRNYEITGTVGHGYGRGRDLGFPTANLEDIKTLVPGHGVYATFASLDGQRYPAVTNIGDNPTFKGEKTTVETFLLAGNPDLYGRQLKLEFVRKLRGEKAFASPSELVDQIRRDVQTARALLAPASD